MNPVNPPRHSLRPRKRDRLRALLARLRGAPPPLPPPRLAYLDFGLVSRVPIGVREALVASTEEFDPGAAPILP